MHHDDAHDPGPSTLAIRPLLRRAGLDEREIDVYLALLAVKAARASEVARRAKQSRSHTYLLLRSLERKGLVSELDRGSVLQFVAEPPGRLLGYVRDRADELAQASTLLEGALPLLQSLTSPLAGRPRVTLLHGIDGMRQIYREMLNVPFVSLFNPAAMFEAFGENVALTLAGPLRGRDLLVDNAASRRYVREVEQSAEYEVRFLPASVSFGTDTMVFADTMVFFAYDADLSIVRVENQNLADSFRAWFEPLWKIGKPAGGKSRST